MDEALKRNSSNTYPFIVCIGKPTMFTSSVVVCNKKVITEEIGKCVVSSLLTLLSVHYLYELSFNPICKLAMEFLQEKFLGDSLPHQKMTTNYCNLFRAINCIELKLSEQPFDDEQTQPCGTF